MSDLIGNPKDQFSRVAAHIYGNIITQVFNGMSECSYFLLIVIGFACPWVRQRICLSFSRISKFFSICIKKDNDILTPILRV